MPAFDVPFKDTDVVFDRGGDVQFDKSGLGYLDLYLGFISKFCKKMRLKG